MTDIKERITERAISLLLWFAFLAPITGVYNGFEAVRHYWMGGSADHALDHLWATLVPMMFILVCWDVYVYYYRKWFRHD